MHERQRSRLLGFGIILTVVCTLVLAACNSNSVTGSQSNVSRSTNAEDKSPPGPANAPRLQGLIGAAISTIK